MIKSFGWYDPSVDYVERNASYLLFVDSHFHVPIVQSKEGFFLVGGGIEEQENIYDCLKREIMEEIGGIVDKLSLICETQTYFYSVKYNDMRKAHNYFLFANNLNICTSNHEDIKLHWLSFSEAATRLTLEHQKWALYYFRYNLKSLTKRKEIIDSINFIDGLKNLDVELVMSVPKSDLHNHAVFGGSQHDFEILTGVKVEPLITQLKTFDEFSEWCDKQVSNQFRNKEGFLQRIEAALITAKKDNITKLCFNISVCSMKFFTSSMDLIDSIEFLRKKYFLDRKFLPELCLDRQKAIDEQYQQWFYDLLQSGYFKMLDLTGDELAPLEPIIPMYRAAEKRGLVLKAHVAEYSNSIVAMETAKRLHLKQIQHGNALAEDTKAIKWLCDSEIQLNMCPSSNYYLARIDSIANHPIKKIFRNNVKVTVNSDDALIFGRTVTDEYFELYKNNVLNAEELNQIRINGLE